MAAKLYEIVLGGSVRFGHLIFGVGIGMFTATVAFSDEPPSEVTVQADIAYLEGPTADPERHRLDVYNPTGTGPFPVLMWIHGGAWAIGHRRAEEQLARRFAERGVAVVAIDHRMSKATWMNPELDAGVEHPAHIEDCAAAFAWVHAHCASFAWDVARLHVGGFSSGAHLAALLASDARYLGAHDLALDTIRGALAVGGAYDLEAYYQAHLEANGKAMADAHVLDVFGRREGALRDASPTTYLGRSTVPMLVISEVNTLDYTRLFEKAVQNSKLTHIRFVHYPDRSHRNIGTLMARQSDDATRDRMIDFIQESAPEPAPRPGGPTRRSPPTVSPDSR